MSMLKNKLNSFAVAILAFGATTISTGAMAQAQQGNQQPATQQTPAPKVTDVELKQFADANNRLMVIQQDGEKAMLAILAEEKLSVEKFSEMAQAHREQKIGEVKASAEEFAAFNRSAQRMMELQPTMEQDMEKAIVKDGMTVERYEQIMMAYQQDPAMQAKVQKLMEQK